MKSCKLSMQKSSFFSQTDSCFKNQIAFLLLILHADSCGHEYKSVNCTDEQIDLIPEMIMIIVLIPEIFVNFKMKFKKIGNSNFNDRNIDMYNQFLHVLLMFSFIFIVRSVEILTSPLLFWEIFPKLMKNYQKYALHYIFYWIPKYIY